MRGLGCVLTVIMSALVLGPAAAHADSVIGGLDPVAPDHSAECGYETAIYVQAGYTYAGSSPAVAPPDGKYIVPVGGGTITSWSVSQQQPGAQLRLAVVNFATGDTSLTVDAYSSLETISSSQYAQTVTFPVDIPVHAGEEIGLDVYKEGASVGCAYPFSGDTQQQVDVAADNGTHAFGQNAAVPKSQVNVQATLAPPGTTPPSGGGTHSPAGLTISAPRIRRVSGSRLRLALGLRCGRPGSADVQIRTAGRHGRLIRTVRVRLTGRAPTFARRFTVTLSRRTAASLRHAHAGRLTIRARLGASVVARTVRIPAG